MVADKMGNWIADNLIAVLTTAVLTLSIAAAVIADQAAEIQNKEHDDSRAAHPEIRTAIQENRIDIQVLAETVRQSNARQSDNITRLERILDRLESD